ncbi:Flp pilus assembly complex ATPase component TadA [Patescibacteria group bacterium]|nr:Flp pilus assembly complex ATPase component TadA [Patescibacteria group bacterium]MBU4512479.1 Flp pilus assembly complex ATPase component TadA [Patescibacteria group bacterium]MCG2692608.1 Flp pilus assembly complex ATPase component TadA [Candidatus Parcubacteria bacterium]
MLPPKQLKQALLTSKLMTQKEIDQTEEESKKKKQSLEEYIISNNLISEELFYETVAHYLKVPFINLKNQIIRSDLLFLIPEPIARTHEVVVFGKTGNEVKLATLNPEDIQTFEFIERKTGLKTKVHLTTPSALNALLKQYHRGLDAKFKELSKEEAPKNEKGEIDKSLKKLAQDLPVIRIVDSILEYAIFENASDIHIEPLEKEMAVRYRIDGILREVMTLPKSAHSGVVARIKVLSNLKLDEHRLPQDGRFKVETKEYKVSFRVSIMPIFDGEKVVMRLLWESGKILTLEQLGLQKRPLDAVKNNIKKPHGMILVTGPTGSGKTTTLYSILNILNQPGVNISTVEDPIEYRMAGVNQSQINPKINFTFAGGLRSLLRQDPDIIMVGEIRDQETADIAINAAMTGHLVLSTLHTNDAVTTLPRLVEMGIPSFLVASTTNVIIAQRLVRKICPNCIHSYNLNEKEIAELSKQLNIEEILKTMAREKIILSPKDSLKSLLFYKGKGCKQCSNEGYKGRVGIYEVLEITNEISKLIIKNAKALELMEAAKKQNMITVLEDGFFKAKTGVTTIEEVLRVAKE